MTDPTPNPDFKRRVIVMGVSGSGKSSIGKGIGQRLGVPYIDGDTYHPQANVEKMERGEPLDDDDRAGWLDALTGLIRDYRDDELGVLIGCSALKRRYRDQLRSGDPHLMFLFLDGSYDIILGRMQQREHFFSPKMLQSQFDTLERPGSDEAVRVDIDADFNEVIAAGTNALQRADSGADA
ncbi:gluconokinase [Salinisphaera sp. Q1T1-3]|uniref:gluconokinase n=1 Tax=Salinisphaera sp. Q1T1-3 TaxID=2321229 RepID=UPI000E71A338|nr:gluconokinase [Salinisphaera sp. Q1T1-3]RJS93159.1 gluconokinase [Salinisphaera sp. Q1T1-3]